MDLKEVKRVLLELAQVVHDYANIMTGLVGLIITEISDIDARRNAMSAYTRAQDIQAKVRRHLSALKAVISGAETEDFKAIKAASEDHEDSD